jgi:hypothetical protein
VPSAGTAVVVIERARARTTRTDEAPLARGTVAVLRALVATPLEAAHERWRAVPRAIAAGADRRARLAREREEREPRDDDARHGSGQVLHVAATHRGVAAPQKWPHAPQFWGSLEVSRHEPAQFVSPVVQQPPLVHD